MQQGTGYRQYPLPGDWNIPLLRLEPAQVPAAAPTAPAITPAIDRLLGVLSEREQAVLHYRWVQGETLERTGEHLGGITRERVRQLEERARKRYRANHELLEPFAQWLAGRGLCVAALPESSSRVWPEATSEELWRFMVHALSAVLHQKYETLRLEDDIWVLRSEACCSERLRVLFETEPRFRRVGDVARSLGVEPGDLKLAVGFEPQLVHFQDGLLGWRRWNNADRLLALAWYLAENGIRTWHFSQMATALAMIWPERFADMTGRDVLGIVSRPGQQEFQNAGRNGIWQLSAMGDGYRNNRDAVVAVLNQAGTPLTVDQIMKRLERLARPATIQALLARDDTFVHVRGGRYTLQGMRVPIQG